MTSGYDVCVVGGAGHVGAPLAIVLASRGMRTLAYDINVAWLDLLRSGKIPFFEAGAEPLLAKVLGDGKISFSSDPAQVAGVPVLIVTIGTPIDEFHNPKVDVVTRCIEQLMPYLSDGQTIILRSTVSPGVTEYLDRFLKARGLKIELAFCPERVVQGYAIEEMQSLPQIVSGLTPQAEETAARIFGAIAPSVVHLSTREAEFAKLMSNAYRYMTFAATNQLYMMASAAGLDYARILNALKTDYPRMKYIPGPGFAAGPCLMKDTMQLAAFNNTEVPLGIVAMQINEGLPSFLVERLAERFDLAKTRVGILGMAFKANIDDTRESLSYKLGKILRFRGATVAYSDEMAKDPTFVTKEQLVANSDVVIVGVPHDAYRSIAVPPGVEVVDLWNVLPSPPSR